MGKDGVPEILQAKRPEEELSKGRPIELISCCEIRHAADDNDIRVGSHARSQGGVRIMPIAFSL